MFKTQKSLLITGLVAYVLYIFVFGIIFGPLEFSWAFYILAAMMGFAFYAMVSDYYPQTEAMEMTKSLQTLRDILKIRHMPGHPYVPYLYCCSP